MAPRPRTSLVVRPTGMMMTCHSVVRAIKTPFIATSMTAGAAFSCWTSPLKIDHRSRWSKSRLNNLRFCETEIPHCTEFNTIGDESVRPVSDSRVTGFKKRSILRNDRNKIHSFHGSDTCQPLKRLMFSAASAAILRHRCVLRGLLRSFLNISAAHPTVELIGRCNGGERISGFSRRRSALACEILC
jgi:hypothetical protein